MDRKCVQGFPSCGCQTGLQGQGRGKEYKNPTLYAEIILLIIPILSQSQDWRKTPSKFSIKCPTWCLLFWDHKSFPDLWLLTGTISTNLFPKHSLFLTPERAWEAQMWSGFPLNHQEASLRTEGWNAMGQERLVPEARAKAFSCKIYSRLHHPTPQGHKAPLPCPGAAGAGRQDLGTSPRNTVTNPDSEHEQPCPSCGCFFERSDLALSKTGIPRNRWNSRTTCFPFAVSGVLFSFSFLRMSLIALHAHFLVWATFNVRKTPRKVNTHNLWFVRQLSKELNVVFSVLLSRNLQVLKLKSLFLIF